MNDSFLFCLGFWVGGEGCEHPKKKNKKDIKRSEPSAQAAEENNNNNNKSFQKAKNTQPEDWENVGAILSTLIRLAFGAMDLDPCLACFTLMICPSWERIHIPKTFGTYEFDDFPYFLPQVGYVNSMECTLKKV